MSNQQKLRRRTVDLGSAGARPSRIRRDPPPPARDKGVQPYPTEREIWAVVIGVILFAIAVTALTFGVSDVTGR